MNFPTTIRTIGATALIATLALTGCGSKDHDNAHASASASGSASSQVVTLLNQGVQQAQAGHFDQATTTFNNVLALDAHNVYALYNLGLVAQSQKQNDQALKQYDAALAVDGNYTPAMYNKAFLLEGSDLDQAIQIYQRIVQINPKASTAYYRLSLAYAKQKNDSAAKDAYNKAIAIDPSLAQAASASSSAHATASAKPKK